MDQVDGQYYEVASPGTLSEKIVTFARDRIYADFLKFCAPTPTDTILDVGVSDVVTDSANVLERRYSPQERITAVGLGAGRDFTATFPKVRYRRIIPNEPLPFEDGTFDVVTSNAVIEHVGSLENQRFFVSELLRVGGRVFITAPHRYFPVEPHTGIPFLHWSDASFKLACGWLGKEKWVEAENLILMTQQRLKETCPEGANVKIGPTGLLLGPCSSNLYLFSPGHRG